MNAGGTASALDPYLEQRRRAVTEGWWEGLPADLTTAMDTAIAELAQPLDPGSAVVAIGGFGRRSMAIHSDVDLLFLHTAEPDGELEQRVLRPLWDARLKVGHLSHTPAAAAVFAGTRLDAISTFLTARHLVGEEAVYADFWQRFARLLDRERVQILGKMAAEELRRRSREPYRLMAADLKNGRGGIRTVDMLDWRRRVTVAQGGTVEADDPGSPLRQVLIRCRSALHVAAGRAHDRYDFELRAAAADWLGMDVASLGQVIVATRREAESLVDERWPELGLSRLQRSDDPFRLIRERHGSPDGDLHRRLIELVPEWAEIVTTPHVVPFHAYPVADHTIAALDAVEGILGPDEPDAVIREVATGIENPDLLRWSVLLHDIGKGRDGPHARIGARMVAEICRRLRVPAEATGLIARIVEHHLLLADLATKYDIDDPAVTALAADRIRDMEALRLLFLLTAADSRATGTDTWTEWRSELIRRAYRKLEREFGRRDIPGGVQQSIMADRVVEASEGTVDHETVIRHLERFGDSYLRNHGPIVVLAHIAAANRYRGRPIVSASGGNPARLLVVSPDTPRLLITVSGFLTLQRLQIIDARFATRDDEVVFDTFEVTAADGAEVDAEMAERLTAELELQLMDGPDLTRAVADKQHSYRHDRAHGIAAFADVHEHPDGSATVDVEGVDRLGLLHDLAWVFEEHDLPILRARVDTMGGTAYDTFHVSRRPVDRDRFLGDLLDALGHGPERSVSSD